MRVLMISKALVQGIYQRKLELIAAHGVELLAITPPVWKDARGDLVLERAYTHGYRLETLPLCFNGNYHLHFYAGLRRVMREFQPHIVHIDEEAYNTAAWQAAVLARPERAKIVFFTWQNLVRRYPPPFAWGESWLMRRADHAIAGTEGAADVLRAKGYRGAISVIAQFGIDPDLFKPTAQRADRPFTVGAVARLVPEKGIDLLIRAAALLANTGDPIRVRIIGGGSERAALETLARELGIADRVTFVDQMPSVEMPAQYHTFDVLAVPSRTLPNWKEQFGPRATVEAMASGVPVIGAHSGAIPDVIADAGLIFPEGDVNALADTIRRLQHDAALYTDYAERGRGRALALYTHERVAALTVDIYRALLEPAITPA